jgi:glycosyltransferase involved in cell wall biosynthesis
VVNAVNQGGYDLVHLHNELFALPFASHLRVPWAITSHYGGLTNFKPGGEDGPFDYLFRDTLLAPAHIALSHAIADLLRDAGYGGVISVVENSVEHELFRVIERPKRPAICLARIASRKRQAWVAEAVAGQLPVDFVGPWSREEEPTFAPRDGSRWLGEWDRATLHERLGEYACLVLISKSEACIPKAVLEALAAGLSLVVSPACAGNLDSEPFVTVVPEGASAEELVAAIEAATASNKQHRAKIRGFARVRFDYEAGIDRYLCAVHEVLAATA